MHHQKEGPDIRMHTIPYHIRYVNAIRRVRPHGLSRPKVTDGAEHLAHTQHNGSQYAVASGIGISHH